jgi:hypothetical protein
MIAKNQHIVSVKAKCGRVQITDKGGKSWTISRREAILRAGAIAGLDDRASDLAESFINAANEALKNETGQGYRSEFVKALLNANKAGKQLEITGRKQLRIK